MTSPSITSQSTSSQRTASDLPPSILLGTGNYENLIRGKLPISSPDDDVSDAVTSQWAPEHPPLSHVIGEISRLRQHRAMTSRGDRPPLMTSSLMQGELKKPQPQMLRISTNQLQARHVPPSYDVTMKRRRRRQSSGSGSGGSLRRKEEEHDSGVAINQHEEKMVFV